MLEVAGLSVALRQASRRRRCGARASAASEIVVILGANGAGKSTLLKAVAGLQPPAPARASTLDDRELLGAAAAPDRRGRPGAGAGGPRHLRRAHGAREPAARRLRAPRPRRRGAQPRARAGAVPAARRAARPDGAHHERRRAADGGDRPRADVGAEDAAARRALARPRRRCCAASCSAPLARIRADGVGVLLVEQNARQSLAIADRGYLIENGRIVGAGRAAELAPRSGGAARLSRRRKGGIMGMLDGRICIVTGAAGSLGLRQRGALRGRGRQGDAGRPRPRPVSTPR